MKLRMGVSDVPQIVVDRLFCDDGLDEIAVVEGEQAFSCIALHPQTNYATATVTVVYATSVAALLGRGLVLSSLRPDAEGDSNSARLKAVYAIETTAISFADVLTDYYRDFVRDQDDLISPNARVDVTMPKKPVSVVPYMSAANRSMISPSGDCNLLVISQFGFRTTTDVPAEAVSLERATLPFRALMYRYGDLGITMTTSVSANHALIKSDMRKQMKDRFHSEGRSKLENRINEFSVFLHDGVQAGEDVPADVQGLYPNLESLIETGETKSVGDCLNELRQARRVASSEVGRTFLEESINEIEQIVQERNRLLGY